MVGDDTVVDTSIDIHYEFIVRDQASGVKVYRTAYKVHASQTELLFEIQKKKLRQEVVSECLILFNFPVVITEVCSDMPMHA